MPQELREPWSRTEEPDALVMRFLTVISWLNAQSVIVRGIQDIVTEAWWPDMTAYDKQILLQAIEMIDSKEEREKTEDNPGWTIKGNTIYFADS